MKPPVAKRIAFERSLHGCVWTDHYHWLRAENWQECIDEPQALPDDIAEYLHAENAWFEHCMSETTELREQLVLEMRGRMQDVDQSLPDREGNWCYLECFEANDEYPRYYRYERGKSIEHETAQLLVDFNHEAQGFEYFDPGDVEYSPAHTHLAWSADTKGSERYRVHIRDLSTGIDTDIVDDVYGISWGDAEHLFYTKVGEDYRPGKVFRHKLGTPCEEDVLVYEEHDTRFSCTVWTSLSDQYVFIGAEMNDESEIWFIPVVAITSEPMLVEPRSAGLEYSIDHQGERFFILTNADGAADFKIMTTPCLTPGRKHWQDWLALREGIMVLDVYVYKHWVMWLERENALPRICFSRSDKRACDMQTLDFDQEAYALSLEPLLEFDESAFRFGYTSPSQPEQTYRFDMQTGDRSLLKEECIPSGHVAEHYHVRRLYARALDGESVPITILYHRDTPIDGSAPCLLTAYGAYGSSIPASFSSDVLSLTDRGFVYAIAHVRGGQEKGRAWYDAARGDRKQNTFDDVVAVARYLVSRQVTAEGRIVLSGGSAGGLLVGAVINQCKELWAGAIADVPFVDALNSLIDDSLPLTPGEWTQWGNPLIDPQAFRDIQAYSPYDNIESRCYPPMLVTAGVSDPRVTYWEPAKWVAAHRHMRKDENMLIFKTTMHSGHFGESGRYEALQDEAIEQAFCLKVTGLLPGSEQS